MLNPISITTIVCVKVWKTLRNHYVQAAVISFHSCLISGSGAYGSCVTLKIRVVEWPLHSLALELILLSAITYTRAHAAACRSLLYAITCVYSHAFPLKVYFKILPARRPDLVQG